MVHYHKITFEKTEFDYTVASLACEFTAEVRDLVLKPPATSPYEMLKEQLIKCMAASEQYELQLLFDAEESIRIPTQLLHRMQQLLGDKTGVPGGNFLHLQHHGAGFSQYNSYQPGRPS